MEIPIRIILSPLCLTLRYDTQLVVLHLYTHTKILVHGQTKHLAIFTHVHTHIHTRVAARNKVEATR